ncbi:hypothetical protein A5764_12925 [Mycobacterium sp. 852002-51057_SCH5723018]|nr:hypothetical protein A5764_12925 [Mycobacterium sp. 852002-51057_SCH5723018]
MVDVESVVDRTDGYAAATGVVRRYHGGPCLCRLSEYPAARDRSRSGVDVEGANVSRSTNLQRTMGEVADEDRRLTRIQPQHRGARRVPGGRPQPQRLADLVVVRPLHELARFLEGRHAVGEYELIAALLGLFGFGARGSPCRGPVRFEVVVVGGGNHVSRVGKCWHPGVTDFTAPHGVPADVVGVDVGVDHDVYGFAVDARRLQCGQELGVQVVQRRHVRAWAVIADARVHDDGQPVDFEDPALNCDVPLVGVGVEELRYQ